MNNLDIYLKNNILRYLPLKEQYLYLSTSKENLSIENSEIFNKKLLKLLKKMIRVYSSNLKNTKERLEKVEKIVQRLRNFSLIDIDNDLL